MKLMRILSLQCSTTQLVVAMLSLALALALPTSAQSLPDVPGYTVEVYAELAYPVQICFAPGGVMYVGGGRIGDPATIKRIEPGGGPGSVSDYGPLLRDPDAVAVDIDGQISGVAGSVLTGGMDSPAHFTAVLPDETALTLWEGPPLDFRNPTDITFDSTGRMLFTDATAGAVFESRGENPPTVLFNTPEYDADVIVVDSQDNIYISLGTGSNGRVLGYHSEGTPFPAPLVTGLTSGPFIPFDFGPGRAWGTALYVLASTELLPSCQLLRVDSPDTLVSIGTGFDAPWYADMVFGPDGALYSCDYGGRILRIAPRDTEGPVTTDVVAQPVPIYSEALVTATVDDSTTGESNIQSAEYSIDGSGWYTMYASDGDYDEVAEGVFGTISAFSTPGVYEVCVRGRDEAENYGEPECTLLAVYDPDGGFVTGGGWIWSPAGAYLPDLTMEGKANFGFVSQAIPSSSSRPLILISIARVTIGSWLPGQTMPNSRALARSTAKAYTCSCFGLATAIRILSG